MDNQIWEVCSQTQLYQRPNTRQMRYVTQPPTRTNTHQGDNQVGSEHLDTQGISKYQTIHISSLKQQPKSNSKRPKIVYYSHAHLCSPTGKSDCTSKVKLGPPSGHKPQLEEKKSDTPFQNQHTEN